MNCFDCFGTTPVAGNTPAFRTVKITRRFRTRPFMKQGYRAGLTLAQKSVVANG